MPPKQKRLLIALTGLCVLGGAALFLASRLTGGLTGPDALVVQEGQRATQVYAEADRVLDVPDGTSEKAARKAARNGTLDLPRKAGGNPEGFLHPGSYPVGSESTPTSLLRTMVHTAREKYAQSGAGSYDTLTLASIVQGEADNPADMGKVARVVKNREQQGRPLEMDSTLNYALNRSTLHTSRSDTRLDNPYNTYRNKGLPPGPINNPGNDALRAAAHPPRGDWLFFVTVKAGDTRFTSSYRQHLQWVAEFNRNQQN